jgi:hypothetical protein
VPAWTHARPLVFGKNTESLVDNNVTINNKNIINMTEQYDKPTMSQYINKTI